MGWRKIGLLAAVGVLVSFGAVFLQAMWGVSRIDFQCDQHPAREAFERYFGPAAAGVTDIRSSGYSSLGGAEVRLRFHATEATLAVLLRRYRQVPPQDAVELSHSLMQQISPAPPSFVSEAEEHNIHWYELERLRAPDGFEPAVEQNGTHEGLVVDHSTGQVYFYHWNQ